MSVILIRPRNEAVPTGIVSTQYPLNLGYLASWLKVNKIEVRLFDYEVEDLDKGKLLSEIKTCKPVLVGISCMTPTIKAGHDIAGFIKENFPGLKIVVGGVHATAIPERTLEEFPSFDIVVKGEGEETVLELYDALRSDNDLRGVKGLFYRVSGSQIKNTGERPLIDNLDSLPFPDRELLNMDLYKRTHTSRAFSRLDRRIAELITARGCPYDCIFCASKVAFGRRVRYRSVENIISEMEECVTKYGTNHFSILDDTFTFKKDILYPVCDYLKAKRLTWDCFTRVDRVDEGIIKKVVDSGCEKVSFGLESGSEKILRLINKNISVSQIKDACRICKKSGLRYLETTFMIGNHPLETMEDIDATTSLIREIDPDLIALSITSPFPGTELNRIMKEGGYINKENWDEFVLYGSRPSWRYEYLTVDKLKDIQRRFTKNFYLRPNYIARQLRKIKTLKEFLYWSRLAIDTVKAS